MKEKHPLMPTLSALTPMDYIVIEDEAVIENILLREQDLSYVDVNFLTFKNIKFEKVAMTHNHLKNFECQNIIFDHCDFSNTEWIGANFHRVLFEHCKLTGTNFAESYLRDCTFNHCVADFSSFSSTNSKIVDFKESSLAHTDFFEMTWAHLYLTNCSLDDSNWYRTKLNSLDLSTNTFSKIALSQELLRGLKVSSEQALIISAALGLIIE